MISSRLRAKYKVITYNFDGSPMVYAVFHLKRRIIILNSAAYADANIIQLSRGE